MFEGIHPLEGGLVRWRDRQTRRPDMPVESAWVFYPKQMRIVVSMTWQWGSLAWKLNQLRRKVENDPSKLQYSDTSLMSFPDEEEEDLDLHQTYGSLLGIKSLVK